jgi:hypothetical protein
MMEAIRFSKRRVSQESYGTPSQKTAFFSYITVSDVSGMCPWRAEEMKKLQIFIPDNTC